MPTGIYTRKKPGWNKGLKMKELYPHAGFQVGNKKWDNPKTEKSRFIKGQHPHNFGKRNPRNKQSNYSIVHQWLKRNFGKAIKCENPMCLRQSKRFEWALVNNRQYEEKRENFIQLCKKCHSKYDNWIEKVWARRREKL